MGRSAALMPCRRLAATAAAGNGAVGDCCGWDALAGGGVRLAAIGDDRRPVGCCGQSAPAGCPGTTRDGTCDPDNASADAPERRALEPAEAPGAAGLPRWTSPGWQRRHVAALGRWAGAELNLIL